MDGIENSDDLITLNGQDLRIGDLLTGGAIFSADRNDLSQSTALLEDDSISEEHPEDDDAVKTCLDFAGTTHVKWREILATPPLKAKILREQDEEFQNLTEDGRVRKKILQNGTGKSVDPDYKVWFHYVAFIDGNPEPFDDTLKRNKPASVKFDPPGDTIPGLTIALKSMQMMETAQVIVHHSLGYRDFGCPPRIPPRANLIYNIKMVAQTPTLQLYGHID